MAVGWALRSGAGKGKTSPAFVHYFMLLHIHIKCQKLPKVTNSRLAFLPVSLAVL